MYPEIAKKLINGAKIHGFSSGGGVRVLRIDNMVGETYYAEGANIDEAFLELEKNIKTGKQGICYMTGGYANGKFDAWTRVQGGFDMVYNSQSGMVEVALNWTHYHHAPREVVETVRQTKQSMTVTDTTGRTWLVSYLHRMNGIMCEQLGTEEERKNLPYSEKRHMTFGAESISDLLVSLETCLPSIQY